MKKIWLISILFLLAQKITAQTFADSVFQHRQNYRNDFIKDEHSPLGAQDTAWLRFFAPDKKYRVIATFKMTPDATNFQMPTHSGKAKTYRKYGYLTFVLKGERMQLEVYQSPDLMKIAEYKDHLFVPFNDLTNYEETYGGGRYLDLSLNDIRDNTVVLDFNKSYNPYCAYASGYSCPIPPEANRLPIPIKAGEKMFGKKTEE